MLDRNASDSAVATFREDPDQLRMQEATTASSELEGRTSMKQQTEAKDALPKANTSLHMPVHAGGLCAESLISGRPMTKVRWGK